MKLTPDEFLKLFQDQSTKLETATRKHYGFKAKASTAPGNIDTISAGTDIGKRISSALRRGTSRARPTSIQKGVEPSKADPVGKTVNKAKAKSSKHKTSYVSVHDAEFAESPWMRAMASTPSASSRSKLAQILASSQSPAVKSKALDNWAKETSAKYPQREVRLGSRVERYPGWGLPVGVLDELKASLNMPPSHRDPVNEVREDLERKYELISTSGLLEWLAESHPYLGEYINKSKEIAERNSTMWKDTGKQAMGTATPPTYVKWWSDFMKNYPRDSIADAVRHVLRYTKTGRVPKKQTSLSDAGKYTLTPQDQEALALHLTNVLTSKVVPGMTRGYFRPKPNELRASLRYLANAPGTKPLFDKLAHAVTQYRGDRTVVPAMAMARWSQGDPTPSEKALRYMTSYEAGAKAQKAYDTARPFYEQKTQRRDMSQGDLDYHGGPYLPEVNPSFDNQTLHPNLTPSEREAMKNSGVPTALGKQYGKQAYFIWGKLRAAMRDADVRAEAGRRYGSLFNLGYEPDYNTVLFLTTLDMNPPPIQEILDIPNVDFGDVANSVMSFMQQKDLETLANKSNIVLDPESYLTGDMETNPLVYASRFKKYLMAVRDGLFETSGDDMDKNKTEYSGLEMASRLRTFIDQLGELEANAHTARNNAVNLNGPVDQGALNAAKAAQTALTQFMQEISNESSDLPMIIRAAYENYKIGKLYDANARPEVPGYFRGGAVLPDFAFRIPEALYTKKPPPLRSKEDLTEDELYDEAMAGDDDSRKILLMELRNDQSVLRNTIHDLNSKMKDPRQYSIEGMSDLISAIDEYRGTSRLLKQVEFGPKERPAAMVQKIREYLDGTVGPVKGEEIIQNARSVDELWQHVPMDVRVRIETMFGPEALRSSLGAQSDFSKLQATIASGFESNASKVAERNFREFIDTVSSTQAPVDYQNIKEKYDYEVYLPKMIDGIIDSMDKDARWIAAEDIAQKLEDRIARENNVSGMEYTVPYDRHSDFVNTIASNLDLDEDGLYVLKDLNKLGFMRGLPENILSDVISFKENVPLRTVSHMKDMRDSGTVMNPERLADEYEVLSRKKYELNEQLKELSSDEFRTAITDIQGGVSPVALRQQIELLDEGMARLQFLNKLHPQGFNLYGWGWDEQANQFRALPLRDDEGNVIVDPETGEPVLNKLPKMYRLMMNDRLGRDPDQDYVTLSGDNPETPDEPSEAQTVMGSFIDANDQAGYANNRFGIFNQYSELPGASSLSGGVDKFTKDFIIKTAQPIYSLFKDFNVGRVVGRETDDQKRQAKLMSGISGVTGRTIGDVIQNMYEEIGRGQGISKSQPEMTAGRRADQISRFEHVVSKLKTRGTGNRIDRLVDPKVLETTPDVRASPFTSVGPIQKREKGKPTSEESPFIRNVQGPEPGRPTPAPMTPEQEAKMAEVHKGVDEALKTQAKSQKVSRKERDLSKLANMLAGTPDEKGGIQKRFTPEEVGYLNLDKNRILTPSGNIHGVKIGGVRTVTHPGDPGYSDKLEFKKPMKERIPTDKGGKWSDNEGEGATISGTQWTVERAKKFALDRLQKTLHEYLPETKQEAKIRKSIEKTREVIPTPEEKPQSEVMTGPGGFTEPGAAATSRHLKDLGTPAGAVAAHKRIEDAKAPRRGTPVVKPLLAPDQTQWHANYPIMTSGVPGTKPNPPEPAIPETQDILQDCLRRLETGEDFRGRHGRYPQKATPMGFSLKKVGEASLASTDGFHNGSGQGNKALTGNTAHVHGKEEMMREFFSKFRAKSPLRQFSTRVSENTAGRPNEKNNKTPNMDIGQQAGSVPGQTPGFRGTADKMNVINNQRNDGNQS
jgi:hypothetical protein